jgi:phosphoadenosine phosphosulfate reductase
MKVVSWDSRRGMIKVNPILNWTDEDMDNYMSDNGVLVNPLHYDDYPSIGCEPCTSRVSPGEDPRSGRWAGMGKVECGIHL